MDDIDVLARELLRSSKRAAALEAALRSSIEMLSAIAGDMEDGVSSEALRLLVPIVVAARDRAVTAIATARGEPPSDQSESNQPDTVPASRTFEA
jgi:hypothetical protein